MTFNGGTFFYQALTIIYKFGFIYQPIYWLSAFKYKELLVIGICQNVHISASLVLSIPRLINVYFTDKKLMKSKIFYTPVFLHFYQRSAEQTSDLSLWFF